MSISAPVKWPQYPIGYEPRQEEPSNLVNPVIPFVYLYTNVIPHLGFIENKRPDGDSVYLYRERGRNSPNLDFNFAFDDANGSIPRIQSVLVTPLLSVRLGHGIQPAGGVVLPLKALVKALVKSLVKSLLKALAGSPWPILRAASTSAEHLPNPSLTRRAPQRSDPAEMLRAPLFARYPARPGDEGYARA